MRRAWTFGARGFPVWRSALLYAGITFGAAFVLAIARDLAIPLAGRRAAVVLWGACVMLAALLAARWVVGRLRTSRGGAGRLRRLQIGAAAAGLIVALELLLSLLLRGISPAAFVANLATFEGGVLLLMYTMVLLAPVVAAPRQ